MEKRKVTSTNIRLIGYDEVLQTLEIEFTNGGVYQYFNVPESEYINFIDSNSVGAFFSKFIKTNYKFEKIV